MKKISILILSISLFIGRAAAKEGMWLPMFLKSLNQTEMQAMGLKLTAEDIYSVNHSSLKDAVISFGGFCTGELISDQGLVLTNHHCGYGQIQSHSSVENDYLTNGYWAKSHKEELPNEGLTATFIVKMEDVTGAVLNGISAALSAEERQKQIRQKIDSIGNLAVEGTHYDAYIRPFYYGNEYYMFITETFKDVRLVGAPPSSIGKYGGDTDNWMWPRHTGDFSLFRIYANENNMPAAYSESNQPYQPKAHLPISLKGIEKGDFTMVFGFPGRTQEYLTSHGIKQIKDVLNPKRIEIREKALEVMDQHMAKSDEVRIKYASKYARVANYWKKWRGENRGLEKSNAIEKKKEQEAIFIKATQQKEEYNGLMTAFKKRYDELEPYAQARSYFVEIPYRKIEIIGLASDFRKLQNIKDKTEEQQKEILESLEKKVNAHFKDYDLATDRDLATVLFKKYEADLPERFVPGSITGKNAADNIEDLFDESIFANKKETMEALKNYEKSFKNIKKDPAYQLMDVFFDIYRKEIKPEYGRLSNEIDSLSKIYVAGLRQFIPGRYYPDANSTMRLAYGKVDDFEPRDAVKYDFYTTTNGILEKYDPTSSDFDLPDRLIELIENEDYGQYADQEGYMPVCFIASNHTTGGNSGSPVINGNGELIGLNFDRNWEGTMSDINYDINQCRNISVDIRYVLFIIDKYAKAKHLIDEMTIVTNKEED